MKFIRIFTSVLIFFTLHASAQIGWKWGVCSTHPNSINNGFDEQTATIDRYGNMFVAGYGWGDSSHFGPFIVNTTMNYKPLVITKIDSAGTFKWAKAVKHADCNIGGMAADSLGNLYVYGEFDSATATVDTFTLHNSVAPQFACFLMKLSPAGDVMWVNVLGRLMYFTFNSLSIDGAGNIYIHSGFLPPSFTLGSTTLFASGVGADALVAKYNPDGGLIWAKSFAGNKIEFTDGIKATPEGSLYITGTSNSDSITFDSHHLVHTPGSSFYMTYVVKLDSGGTVQWANKIDYRIVSYNMTTDSAENLYMAGQCDTNVIIGTDTNAYRGRYDVFLARYNSNGVYAWSRTAGGTGSPSNPSQDAAYGLSVDNCGNLWVSGTISYNGTDHSIYFDTTLLVTPPSSEPMFVANYDVNGNFHEAFSIASGGDDMSDVLIDNKGNLFVTGDYISQGTTLTFGSTTLPTNVGYEVLFLAKYTYQTNGCSSLSIPEVPGQSGFTIFPNPATNECTITSYGASVANSRLEMFDITGKLVRTYHVETSTTSFSVSDFAPGVYICRLITENKPAVTKKLVIAP